MTRGGLYGRVVKPIPATDEDFVHVKFPLQDGGQQVVPCRWQGGTPPDIGDPCCVIFTDEHPWALGVGCCAPGPPTSSPGPPATI